MKKILGIIFSAAMLCSFAACSAQDSSGKEETTAPATEASAEAVTTDSKIEAAMNETIEESEFEGVIYAVKNGTVIASYANGKLENGKEITLDSPMPVGSVSKQFCAAAVMLLQEKGKLSVNDTLDKFFPDYKEGKNVTLHSLLSMRSGIPELAEENADVATNENTEEENKASIKKWVFSQPLEFEPDSSFAYRNINFFMLSTVIEQVTGQRYIDFLRDSFFTPLGMTHTGSIVELAENPSWAQENVYNEVDTQPGLTNGCGDIISNAADMTVWINALADGTAISEESFKTMTTDQNSGEHYGYGMFTDIEEGAGHYGAIGIYSAFDYISNDKSFTLFVCSNTIYPPEMTGLANDFLYDLTQ